MPREAHAHFYLVSHYQSDVCVVLSLVGGVSDVEFEFPNSILSFHDYSSPVVSLITQYEYESIHQYLKSISFIW